MDEFELDAVDNGEAVILKLVTKVPELELVRFLNVLLQVEATQLLRRLCDVLHQQPVEVSAHHVLENPIFNVSPRDFII